MLVDEVCEHLRALLRAAVLNKTRALYILHDEPRCSIGESARVIEPRDKRMPELGQCLDLAAEAFAACRREPRVGKELDRDQIAGVFALRQPDHAHPAFAQYTGEPVRSEFP